MKKPQTLKESAPSLEPRPGLQQRRFWRFLDLHHCQCVLTWSCCSSHIDVCTLLPALFFVASTNWEPKQTARTAQHVVKHLTLSLCLPSVTRRSGELTPLYTSTLLYNNLPSELRSPNISFSLFHCTIMKYLEHHVRRPLKACWGFPINNNNNNKQQLGKRSWVMAWYGDGGLVGLPHLFVVFFQPQFISRIKFGHFAALPRTRTMIALSNFKSRCKLKAGPPLRLL